MKKPHRGWLRHARTHIPVGSRRLPLSGFLLAICAIAFSVAWCRGAEAAEPTRHLAFIVSNTLALDANGHAQLDRDGNLVFVTKTSLDVTNVTNAEIDFSVPGISFGVDVQLAPGSTRHFQVWPATNWSGLAFADLPAGLYVTVTTVDANHNPIVGYPLVSSSHMLLFPDLLWGADNRPYVIVAGDVEDVQFFDGYGVLISVQAIKAPYGPGSALILPVPLGAVRALVRPLIPLICPTGGCTPSVVYAEAFDARQSGRYEFNNVQSAVEVSP